MPDPRSIYGAQWRLNMVTGEMALKWSAMTPDDLRRWASEVRDVASVLDEHAVKMEELKPWISTR